MNLTQVLMNIALGGSNWILGLLIVLSVLSIAVIIERGVVSHRLGRETSKLWDNLKVHIEKNGITGISQVLSSSSSPIARIIDAGISVAGTDIEPDNKVLASHTNPFAMKEAMEQEAVMMKMSLEKRLAFLGTLGANAPFIGLFGTVLGIIHSFKDLSISGQGGESVIIGIAEALVATAVGLWVAIPAAIFYNVFKKKIGNMLIYADALTHMVLKGYHQGKGVTNETT
jgi:biopolymer transport protein ExbB